MKDYTDLDFERNVEMRLLMMCIVFVPDEKVQEEISKLLEQPIRWDLFYQLVIKNRVWPLVYKNLNHCINKAENPVFLRIENQYKRSQLSSLLLVKELIIVMEYFNKHDIKAISVKGPLLAKSLYGDIAMRASRDLDILVPISELQKVDDLLSRMNYVKDEPIEHLTNRQERYIINTFHHYSYHNSSGVQLEIHWRLSTDYDKITFEEIWKNRREVFLFGRKMNVLGEEENLAYLILHGSKHGWKRIRWLCDVKELLKDQKIDREKFEKRCRELKILHLVEQTYFLFHVVFQSEDKSGLRLSGHKRAVGKRLAKQSAPFLWSVDEEAELYQHPLYGSYKRYMLTWNQGILKKMKYLMGHFKPTTEDFKLNEIEDRYFFLYYFFRLRRMGKRCIHIIGNKLVFHKNR